MIELAKSDIFFLITAGAVILITVVVLVALYYIVRILRGIENITETVKGETKNIVEDVALVRKIVEKGGGKVGEKVKNVISKVASLEEEPPKKKKNGSKKKETKK